MRRRDGSAGWDEYAAFYDWENLRTFGRRDVAFWSRLAEESSGPVLELGCGTGRLLVPVARHATRLFGIDRSPAMLHLARRRARRLARVLRPHLVQGDIRALPFANRSFHLIMAPYGLLQSLLSDHDLADTLAEAVRVVKRGGLLAIDLVPDLPSWAEYPPRVRLQGRGPGRATITLIESVRQDRARRLTIFDEEFVLRRGRSVERRQFSLTFRTIAVDEVVSRVERAGCRIDSVDGDYAGGPYRPDADVWLIRARRR